MQESNKLITFSALRLPDDVHHLFLLPLGLHLIRIQPELRWPHQPATGAASAAASLVAYSSAATGALIDHFRRGSLREINRLHHSNDGSADNIIGWYLCRSCKQVG